MFESEFQSSVEDERGCSEHKARGPVSHLCSSNPACGFPAPGFPTGFFVGSAQSFPRLLHPATELPWKPSDPHGAYQAFANVPLRSFFDSAPEVRALRSAGITRLQRSYGPVRLPVPAAIPSDGVGTKLHRHWVSLSNAVCLPNMPCSLPRWTEPVLVSVASRLVLPSPFPRRVGVHDFAFEACSSFTRVTACRVARPPYGGLCHEASTRSVTRPGRSLATMFTDNYMGGSFPHWQTAPARRTRKFWFRDDHHAPESCPWR